MKGIKLKISDLELLNLEEIEISNPDCLNDKNWKILKQFRKKVSNPGEKVVYVYYLLVECIKCGEQKLIAKKGAKRSLIKCENCLRQSYVGNIYGPYKVLAYDHSEKVFTNRTYTYHYYKVECIHCGKQFLKILNTAQWKKYNKCSKCNSISNDFFINSMYSAYKESAKNRKIEFNLSGEDFQKFSRCRDPHPEPRRQRHPAGPRPPWSRPQLVTADRRDGLYPLYYRKLPTTISLSEPKAKSWYPLSPASPSPSNSFSTFRISSADTIRTRLTSPSPTRRSPSEHPATAARR